MSVTRLLLAANEESLSLSLLGSAAHFPCVLRCVVQPATVPMPVLPPLDSSMLQSVAELDRSIEFDRFQSKKNQLRMIRLFQAGVTHTTILHTDAVAAGSGGHGRQRRGPSRRRCCVVRGAPAPPALHPPLGLLRPAPEPRHTLPPIPIAAAAASGVRELDGSTPRLVHQRHHGQQRPPAAPAPGGLGCRIRTDARRGGFPQDAARRGQGARRGERRGGGQCAVLGQGGEQRAGDSEPDGGAARPGVSAARAHQPLRGARLGCGGRGAGAEAPGAAPEGGRGRERGAAAGRCRWEGEGGQLLGLLLRRLCGLPAAGARVHAGAAPDARGEL